MGSIFDAQARGSGPSLTAWIGDREMTQEQAIKLCRDLNAPYPVKYRQHHIWFDGAKWHVSKAWNGEARQP